MNGWGSIFSHSVDCLFTRHFPLLHSSFELHGVLLFIVGCVPRKILPMSLLCIKLLFLLAISKSQVLCCGPWSSWSLELLFVQLEGSNFFLLSTHGYPVFPFVEQAASYPVSTSGFLQKSGSCNYMDLYLDPLFYSTDLCVCFMPVPCCFITMII